MATKTKISRPYNRKAAAQALFGIAKSYENVTYATIYRNCYFSQRYGCWKYSGKAHDYSY